MAIERFEWTHHADRSKIGQHLGERHLTREGFTHSYSQSNECPSRPRCAARTQRAA
jgi:hypothetical protein